MALDSYPKPVGLEHVRYALELGHPVFPPLSEKERLNALEQTYCYLSKNQANFMGFQANQNLNYSAELSRFLDMHLNNIGDPFNDGNCIMNTKYMERAVLDYYAALWHAKYPHTEDDDDAYWGFVLTMGSTEGNMYALWNARDYLSGKVLLLESAEASKMQPATAAKAALPRLVYRQAKLPEDNPNAFSPVAFYSEDTHYSFAKATRLVTLPLFHEVGAQKYPGECPLGGEWPDEVPSEGGAAGPGTIDIEKLKVLVEFFAEKGHPIFVSFNYGSTFKGAYDNVEEAGKAVLDIVRKYGLENREIVVEGTESKSFRHGYWIHVDGALGAAYMPYLQMAHSKGLFPGEVPKFDFELDFVHSIAMSGHKWPGAPIPCGVYMSKRKYQMRPPSNPIYVGTPDTTFAGSRNALSPLFFWNSIAKSTLLQQIEKAVRCQKVAGYIESQLKELQSKVDVDLWTARSEQALTVRFRKPVACVVTKYSLSIEDLVVDGMRRTYCHVFAMDHVTHQTVDSLVKDLEQYGFDSEAETPLTAVRSTTAELAPDATFVPAFGRGWR